MKVAWGLDGAGHLLEECIEVLGRLSSADLFVSRSADEVLSLYNLTWRVGHLDGITLQRQKGITLSCAGRFSRGEYDALVLAPASSNSVAKFVCGISDSLTTNLFAAAGKSRVHTLVLPTDTSEEIDSRSPSGRVKVYPRKIDLENVRCLRQFENVSVVLSVEELEEAVRRM